MAQAQCYAQPEQKIADYNVLVNVHVAQLVAPYSWYRLILAICIGVLASTMRGSRAIAAAASGDRYRFGLSLLAETVGPQGNFLAIIWAI